MAILVFFEALLLFIFFWNRSRFWRASWMDAALVWGVLVTAITESLGVFNAINRGGITIAWAIACVVTLALFIRYRNNGPQPIKFELTPDLAALLAGAALLAVAVGLTAWIAPPNTVDAMRYHLPRLVAWLENGNLGFFPAPDAQQLFQPPWSEFAMLQLFALAGGDGLVNFVEWFSLIGCAIAASLIAQRLGAGLRGQTLAVVISIAIPQGLLQASGAKNDYVEAFWLAAFTYFLLNAFENRRWDAYAKAGVALGLALLTKGNAYVYAPGVALACWLAVAPKPTLLTLRRAAIIPALALVINAGHYTRNLYAYGSPLGCSSADCAGNYRFRNDRLNPSDLFANILRNAALQLNTSDRAFSDAVYRDVEDWIRDAGGDPNDPATTWLGTTFLRPNPDRHEDLASNPLHFLLLPICILLALRRNAWRARRLGYAAGLTLAFLLFCAALRWQPWHTRLHLPLFVLWSPFIAVILEAAISAWLGAAIGATLLLFAWPYAIENQSRPLAGPTKDVPDSILNLDRYTLYRAPASYLEMAREVDRRQCSNVGVYGYFDYPLLAAMHAGFGRRVQSLGAQNSTLTFEHKDWKPCAILCMGCTPLSDASRRYRAQGDSAITYPEGLLITGIAPNETHAAGAWESQDRELRFGQADDLPIMFDSGAIGVFRGGQWFLNTGASFAFGQPGDIPVMGDWDGSGKLRIGVFRAGEWWVDANGDQRWDARDRVLHFGQAGDIPVVGDWDGSGKLRIGVFRAGEWWVDWNGDFIWDHRDRTLHFGQPGDLPVVGDWDNTNRMRIGVFRNGDWLLDINGNNAYDPADRITHFGHPGDLPAPLTWHGHLWTFRPVR